MSERNSATRGPVALVTGASRGIGAGIAERFLDRGFRVAGTYRIGGELVQKLAAAHPDRVLPVDFDLAAPERAASVIEQVVDRWGRLDHLVLNAALWNGGKLATITVEDWWRVIEVNLKGTAALTRAAIPWLVQGENPAVVLIGSAVGTVGFPGDTAYASVKAAAIGFARSLAKELAPHGVRVNVLAPGFIDTDMTATVPDASRRAIADATLLGRFGTVEEIARAAVFLTTDATFCTGAVLAADGGWTL